MVPTPGPGHHREHQPTAARIRQVVDREPTPNELALFQSAHHALTLGAPARVRRAAARLISRG
jgi:hypothetical protein